MPATTHETIYHTNLILSTLSFACLTSYMNWRRLSFSLPLSPLPLTACHCPCSCSFSVSVSVSSFLPFCCFALAVSKHCDTVLLSYNLPVLFSQRLLRLAPFSWLINVGLCFGPVIVVLWPCLARLSVCLSGRKPAPSAKQREHRPFVIYKCPQCCGSHL